MGTIIVVTVMITIEFYSTLDSFNFFKQFHIHHGNLSDLFIFDAGNCTQSLTHVKCILYHWAAHQASCTYFKICFDLEIGMRASIIELKPDVVVCACSPVTQEAKMGGS